MKRLCFALLIMLIKHALLIAQPFPSWSNYTFSQRTSKIHVEGNDVWVSTQGMLVKYNKTTGQKSFYNRASANLPDNNIIGLCYAGNGNIWVGGKHYGVGMYNGEVCVNYGTANSGLPANQYNTVIKEDKEGNIWIASFRWMVKFNGITWKTWITGSEHSAFPIVSDFDIDDKGIVWVISSDGIAKIEEDEYTIVSSIGSSLNTKNNSVECDNNQNVWFAVEYEGIYKYHDSVFTLYDVSNSDLPTNMIYDISFDADSAMWLATDTGLVKFDSIGCSVFTPDTDQTMLTIQCDGNDTIWCGTFSGKLLCFDGTGFTPIDLSNSALKNNYITDILTDQANNVWMGTKKNLAKKTGDQFVSVFDRYVDALAEDTHGVVWVAFAEGDTALLKMDLQNPLVFDSINSPFGDKSINSMIVDNYNNLWIATRGYGLYKYDGVGFTNYNTGNSSIPSNEITELNIDKNNNLWGGSSGGLFSFNGSSWTVWNTSNSSIPTNMVTGLDFDPDGRLWFSCMDEGRVIGIEYGGGLTSLIDNQMTNYTIYNSGLLSNTIWEVYADNSGYIWLATCDAGVMCFDRNNQWISCNTSNSGIANNIVQVISKDKYGYIWLGHIDAGVSVFSPDSFLGIEDITAGGQMLNIFPNPVKDDMYIKFDAQTNKTIQINIYDILGRLVYSKPGVHVNPGNPMVHLNLSGIILANQVYFLRTYYNSEYLSAKFVYSK